MKTNYILALLIAGSLTASVMAMGSGDEAPATDVTVTEVTETMAPENKPITAGPLLEPMPDASEERQRQDELARLRMTEEGTTVDIS
jgi:hypothetical protein